MERICRRIDEGKGRIILYLVMAVLCISVSYLGERYFFNREALSGEGLNTVCDLSKIQTMGFEYREGILEGTASETELMIPAGGYIDKIKIEYETPATAFMWWSTEIVNMSDTSRLWYCEDRTDTIIKTVASNGDHLMIRMVDVPVGFRIKAISFQSEYVFHWQRFLLIAAVMFTALLVLTGGKKFQYRPEGYVAVICFLLGIAMLANVPYEKHSWDDETHFANAYQMAYALQGKDTQWTQATDAFIDLELPFAESYEERLLNKERLDASAKNDTRIEEKVDFGFFMGHLDAVPTAVGILLMRALGMSFSQWFVAARLINLLLYTIMVYFAVKITPVAKNLLAFLALMPTPLFLTISYNTDYVINGLMMLGTAMFLKQYLTPKEELKKGDVAVFVLSMFFACIRKIIYIPLILLGVLLPKSKFTSKRQRTIYYGILFGTFAAVMIFLGATATGMTDVRGGDTSVAGQVAYIFGNIPGFAVMFVKEILSYSIDFLFDSQAKMNFNIAGMLEGTMEIVLIIFLSFQIICAKGHEKEKQISMKTSVLGLGLIGLVVCFIWGSMYLAFTPVGSNVINGVQARYYLPFMYLLFVLLPFGKVKSYISENAMMKMSLLVIIVANAMSVYKVLLSW